MVWSHIILFFVIRFAKRSLTVIAAARTSCNQACASVDEQCVATCNISARAIVVSRNSKTSPAQSSDSSSKGWVLAAIWAMKASRAHAKTVVRAAGVAQRKDDPNWYSCKGSAAVKTDSSEADKAAQCAVAAEIRAVGFFLMVAKTAAWCSRMAQQASSVARSRGVAPF